MMSWNLVTFAYGEKKFIKCQEFLSDFLEKFDVKSFQYSPEDLKQLDVYKDNKDYFVAENKYGHCSWKPILVLEAMKSLKDGDKIILCDVDDFFHPDIFSYVDEVMGEDFCLLIPGFNSQKSVTKRDCFVFMNCDEKDYWNVNQLEAGVSFWKVCDESKNILNEWLKWCLDEKVNGEDSDFSGKDNFPEFHGFCGKDQSILTNLAVRDGLSVDNGNIRNYVECNCHYWYERNDNSNFSLGRVVDQLLLDIKEEYPRA